MPPRTPIADGKTKTIYPYNYGCVLIVSKDDVTAGDGARRDSIAGKAVAATETTTNVFRLLEKHGIPTHWRGRVNRDSFLARQVNMIPLELVARRIATGSYLKRNPTVREGTVFSDVLVEFFLKDDTRHDPLVCYDAWLNVLTYYQADQPLYTGWVHKERVEDSRLAGYLTEELERELIRLTRRVFTVLEQAWAEQTITLVDMKIECGFDALTGRLLVADVIDDDSWRLWPGGNKSQMLDKQLYRDSDPDSGPEARTRQLELIRSNYVWVAAATKTFLKP